MTKEEKAKEMGIKLMEITRDFYDLHIKILEMQVQLDELSEKIKEFKNEEN